jgi:hypothetical protein
MTVLSINVFFGDNVSHVNFLRSTARTSHQPFAHGWARPFALTPSAHRCIYDPPTLLPRHLALSGLIFPSLPADKLFPAIHQDLLSNRIQQQVFAVSERTFVGSSSGD